MCSSVTLLLSVTDLRSDQLCARQLYESASVTQCSLLASQSGAEPLSPLPAARALVWNNTAVPPATQTELGRIGRDLTRAEGQGRSIDRLEPNSEAWRLARLTHAALLDQISARLEALARAAEAG